MSRAFKSIDQQITTGSDYTTAKRRSTIFKSIRDKVRTRYGAESVAYRDNTFTITWCKDGAGIPEDVIYSNFYRLPTAKLRSVRSYESYIDLCKGKRLTNPVLNGATAAKFNIFTGNFALVHPKTPFPVIIPTTFDLQTQTLRPVTLLGDHNAAATHAPGDLDDVNTITFPNTSQSSPWQDIEWNQNNYPGWYFDPYGIVGDLNCNATKGSTLAQRLVSQVEIIYRWSPAYWRSVAGQSMSGIAFPEAVTFSQQATQNDELTIKYGPLPLTSASNNLYLQSFFSNDGSFAADASVIGQDNAGMMLQIDTWCQYQGSSQTQYTDTDEYQELHTFLNSVVLGGETNDS